METQKDPYSIPDAAVGSSQLSKPLFWSRMVRYSVHFTIIGIILAGLKMYVVVNHARAAVEQQDDHSTKVTAMNESISGILGSLGFAALFLIAGIASILVSLVMRHLEKKRRQPAN